MQFTFIVCNDSEILDRLTRQRIGRMQRPRWHGDVWRATVAERIVEAPTQSQLRVAIQRRLDGEEAPDEMDDSARTDLATQPQPTPLNATPYAWQTRPVIAKPTPEDHALDAYLLRRARRGGRRVEVIADAPVSEHPHPAVPKRIR